MSIQEQINFLKTIYPFDQLKKTQIEEFSQNLDIMYLKKPNYSKKIKDPENLYLIMKGIVQEKNEEKKYYLFIQ
ncbi:MAG: hypothetical protein ACNI3H_13430 [Halarcobacter ebronensis]